MTFRFEGLEVWQMSRGFADLVQSTAYRFPDHEKFGLTNQLTRAADSICLNIAEGSGRESSVDFARFLSIAHGSAFEVAAALIKAKDRHYLDESLYVDLYDRAEQLSRAISGFRASLLRKSSR